MTFRVFLVPWLKLRLILRRMGNLWVERKPGAKMALARLEAGHGFNCSIVSISSHTYKNVICDSFLKNLYFISLYLIFSSRLTLREILALMILDKMRYFKPSLVFMFYG